MTSILPEGIREATRGQVAVLRESREQLIRSHALARVANFCLETGRSRRRSGANFRQMVQMVSAYPSWSESVRSESSPIDMGLPWLVYPAIDFLDRQLRPGDRVFEFGSGGSTVFMASHGANGVSIEHDAAWAEKVRSTLPHGSNWEIRLIPPALNSEDDDADLAFGSNSPDFYGMSFRDYVGQVSSYPPNHFDWLLVDGRARSACTRYGSSRLKPGGRLIIDNSNRPEYRAEIHALLNAGWVAQVFRGAVPASSGFSATSVLRKPWTVS